MLSFCCRKHQPNWKGSSSHWDEANWKRSFKFMILILNGCNLQFFHNGRFETIIFVYNCKVEGLDVPACNFFSVQCVLIGVRFAIKWTNIEKPYMQRKWFYYNKAIPKRKCFFILNLRNSDGTLCKQDSGAGSSLWSLRSASWEHCSTLVQHILDWQHILMGTKTLPSFSALLVWFFLFLHTFPQQLLLGGY